MARKGIKRKSEYDAFVWLGKVFKSGFTRFTVNQIKDIYDRGCFIKMYNTGYITCSGREVVTYHNGVTYDAKVWEMNLPKIKASKWSSIFTED
jgi:hypothetical protein